MYIFDLVQILVAPLAILYMMVQHLSHTSPVKCHLFTIPIKIPVL